MEPSVGVAEFFFSFHCSVSMLHSCLSVCDSDLDSLV
jgi:hypothetical protein